MSPYQGLHEASMTS